MVLKNAPSWDLVNARFELENARSAYDSCLRSCNEYACVRTNRCTGEAGRRLEEARKSLDDFILPPKCKCCGKRHG